MIERLEMIAEYELLLNKLGSMVEDYNNTPILSTMLQTYELAGNAVDSYKRLNALNTPDYAKATSEMIVGLDTLRSMVTKLADNIGKPVSW